MNYGLAVRVHALPVGERVLYEAESPDDYPAISSAFSGIQGWVLGGEICEAVCAVNKDEIMARATLWSLVCCVV